MGNRWVGICAFFVFLQGCGGPGGDQASNEATTASPTSDPSEQQIDVNLDFRIDTQQDPLFNQVGQTAVLSSRDPNTYNIRYMTFNGRSECVLYPVADVSDNTINRFDVIQNIDDDEKIYEGTVTFRTGDQARVGRLINLSTGYANKEIVPYDVCGRPSSLEVFFDQGRSKFDIYLWGD
jgi:hypothetical protein